MPLAHQGCHRVQPRSTSSNLLAAPAPPSLSTTAAEGRRKLLVIIIRQTFIQRLPVCRTRSRQKIRAGCAQTREGICKHRVEREQGKEISRGAGVSGKTRGKRETFTKSGLARGEKSFCPPCPPSAPGAAASRGANSDAGNGESSARFVSVYAVTENERKSCVCVCVVCACVCVCVCACVCVCVFCSETLVGACLRGVRVCMQWVKTKESACACYAQRHLYPHRPAHDYHGGRFSLAPRERKLALEGDLPSSSLEKVIVLLPADAGRLVGGGGSIGESCKVGGAWCSRSTS